jgi:5-methylcytosine-specific restriction endonuclease McrA
MISIDCPTLDAGDVFTTCISRVKDASLKARLTAITGDITAASADYIDKAQNNRLHEVVRQGVVGTVTTAEMEKVYTQRMAGKKAPGRAAYDEIFNSSAKCLLCTQRKVDTLDHHLPKAHYPVLAVSPVNLIPACASCNKAKLASIPTTADEAALHPYFDCVEDERWLHGSVVQGAPAVVKFRVQAPAQWSGQLASRLQVHFNALGLGDLYSAEAADELSSIRHQLVGIHGREGFQGVREELIARFESASAARLNGWRAVTFESFAANDWFCDGGFAEV